MSLLSLYANQTITHERATGVDANGQATYAAGVSRQARVEERLRLVTGPTAELVQSVAQLWLENDATNPIAPDDRVTYDSRTWHVIAVEKPIQQSGTSPFVRVFLGVG